VGCGYVGSLDLIVFPVGFSLLGITAESQTQPRTGGSIKPSGAVDLEKKIDLIQKILQMTMLIWDRGESSMTRNKMSKQIARATIKRRRRRRRIVTSAGRF
jgi:hypothetical protein